jgi:ribonuclease PH
MRNGDRKPAELRVLKFEVDYVPWALGSVLIAAGQTRVLCNVSEMAGAPAHRLGTGSGWITAEYAMLPHAGDHRSPRDGRPKVKGRTIEIQRLIGRSLRAGVNLTALGERTLTIDCDVLTADGGTRTTAVTGAWLALRIALHRLFTGQVPSNLLLAETVAGVSTGLVDGDPLLDLDYSEDSRAAVDLNFIGTGDGNWVEVQATAESYPQKPESFTALFHMAEAGVKTLCSHQSDIMSEYGIM